MLLGVKFCVIFIKCTFTLIKNKQEVSGDSLEDSIRNRVITKPNRSYLSDVVGLEQAKNWLMKAISMPQIFPKSFKGSNAMKAVFLLYGLPGGGKTHLVNAVAYEAHVEFGYSLLPVNANSMLRKYLGESEKVANCLFDVAAEVKPCIVFLDEADQLLSSRDTESSECVNRVKAQFLVRLWEDLSDVVVICATNRPWKIDDGIMSR